MQFDSTFCSAIEKFLEIAIMLGFVERLTTKFHDKHLEIIRDCCFDFFA